MIALLVLVAAVVAVLEWNHRRTSTEPLCVGSDRDRARLLDDLRAATDRPCADW